MSTHIYFIYVYLYRCCHETKSSKYRPAFDLYHKETWISGFWYTIMSRCTYQCVTIGCGYLWIGSSLVTMLCEWYPDMQCKNSHQLIFEGSDIFKKYHCKTNHLLPIDFQAPHWLHFPENGDVTPVTLSITLRQQFILSETTTLDLLICTKLSIRLNLASFPTK